MAQTTRKQGDTYVVTIEIKGRQIVREVSPDRKAAQTAAANSYRMLVGKAC